MEPYFGLQSAPRAEAIPLSRLILSEVRSGRLRIPEFQRGLRWKAPDNVRLFDSILRGYPIGSMLIWERQGSPTDISRIGGVLMRVESRHDAWFVVDGQQRLTALAGAMLADASQEQAYKIRLDFNRWALISEERSPTNSSHTIPLSTLVDTAAFRAWARRNDADDATLARLDELAARIRNYAIPLYFVETDDEDVLREVYTRMNSTGARMAAHEVFQALPTRIVGGPDRVQLADLHALCTASGFGDPDSAELLKIVLAVAGLDPTRRPDELLAHDLASLPKQEDVATALSHVLRFLREDVGIPHLRLLPYPVVLSILARFFHLHPNPDKVNRDALTRWVWRGAVTGAHQRAAVSKMRETLWDIGEDEHRTIRILLRKLVRPDPGRRNLERRALSCQERP